MNNKVITPWVSQEKQRRLTLEALADVENGNVIDHQVVHNWAQSLSTNKSLPNISFLY